MKAKIEEAEVGDMEALNKISVESEMSIKKAVPDKGTAFFMLLKRLLHRS